MVPDSDMPIVRRVPVGVLFAAIVLSTLHAGCGSDRWLTSNLHDAVRDGDTQGVRHSLDKGASINGRDPRGRTPLYTAASYGYTEIVRLLLEKGAAVNAGCKYKDPSTPLLVACRNGHLAVVRTIIDFGASVMSTNQNGVTPLHFAAWDRHAEIVEFLLGEGADPNATDNTGNTPLHSMNEYDSCYNVDFLNVVQHLVSAGAEASRTNRHGKTALHDAVMFGNGEVAAFLVAHGADPTSSSGSYLSPLKLAQREEDREMVRVLRRAASRRKSTLDH